MHWEERLEPYASDDCFRARRKAAAAIITTRSWVAGALDLTVSNEVHPPSVHRRHLRRNLEEASENPSSLI
jgi:hypothetical protein